MVRLNSVLRLDSILRFVSMLRVDSETISIFVSGPVSMLASILILMLVGAGAFAEETPPMPRSDGQTLHVDFEQYADGWVGPLNAGVRWLGNPFTDIKQNITEIQYDVKGASDGGRCAYIFTDADDQRGRIILQRRYDAPEFTDEVIEFIFRPTRHDAADLSEFVIWSGLGYDSGPVGIQLIANGEAKDRTYRIDVLTGNEDSARQEGVLTGLPQHLWQRFIMRRKSKTGMVDLWVGLKGQERWIGRYPGLHPDRATGRVEIGDTSSETRRGSGIWDSIRIGAPLEAGAKLAAPETMRDVSKETEEIAYPITVDSTKQLFVDDALLESMDGLERAFRQVEKHPDNPLLVPETAWETGGRWYVPYNVLWQVHGKTLRVWYGSYRRSKSKLTYTCVADSSDGIHWERPSLGIFDFEGSKENNIVWSGRGIKVNYDPRDPDPGRRYKGMTRVDGFTAMVSPDGLNWTMASQPAVSQAYDATSFSWNPVEQKWVASCKIWADGKRARGYAESEDFDHWTDTYLMLKADERDHPEDQLYSMWVFRYESVFIGLLKVFHVHTDRCDVQLAFSRNAKHWERPNREAFLYCSDEKGAYDYGNLDPVADPIPMGDDLWIYYGGRSLEHYEEPTDTNGSLCLATLRLDGFVSLKAGAKNGELITRPLRLEGEKLYINADASAGKMRVEILDSETQKAMAPYTLKNCKTITQDNVHCPVTWNRAKNLDAIRGKSVRLRIQMRNADLYSFWTE